MVEKFLILKIHQKQEAFLRVLMHVRNFSIAMKRELKMNTQNTRSGMYLCVHFQRYLCAHVEDRDTKRARFFAPESREKERKLCGPIFEEKKRRKKIQKKFKNTQQEESLVFLLSCFTVTNILSDTILSFLISESDKLTSCITF